MRHYTPFIYWWSPPPQLSLSKLIWQCHIRIRKLQWMGKSLVNNSLCIYVRWFHKYFAYLILCSTQRQSDFRTKFCFLDELFLEILYKASYRYRCECCYCLAGWQSDINSSQDLFLPSDHFLHFLCPCGALELRDLLVFTSEIRPYLLTVSRDQGDWSQSSLCRQFALCVCACFPHPPSPNPFHFSSCDASHMVSRHPEQ